jgi:pimeloyl-ACP methyl ester carboxylesterase
MLINYYYGQKMKDYKMSRKIFSLLILYAALALTSSGYSQNSGIALSSDNVEINFDVLGDGKPALVFVHGWSNDRSIWDSQISYFSKKYKVVAVDLPGFGKSGNNRRNWTVPAFGGDVAAVIEKLDLDNVVLVGFSLGGPVVIETENKIPRSYLGSCSCRSTA